MVLRAHPRVCTALEAYVDGVGMNRPEGTGMSKIRDKSKHVGINKCMVKNTSKTSRVRSPWAEEADELPHLISVFVYIKH